ncbi:UNVERIFIED_CONTAM: hypothetical protein K2H54_033546 [Gekko kuhli]
MYKTELQDMDQQLGILFEPGYKRAKGDAAEAEAVSALHLFGPEEEAEVPTTAGKREGLVVAAGAAAVPPPPRWFTRPPFLARALCPSPPPAEALPHRRPSLLLPRAGLLRHSSCRFRPLLRVAAGPPSFSPRFLAGPPPGEEAGHGLRQRRRSRRRAGRADLPRSSRGSATTDAWAPLARPQRAEKEGEEETFPGRCRGRKRGLRSL